MAELVSTSQQVQSMIAQPRTHYSRVISLYLPVVAGGGWAFASTPPVGNEVWLYSVKVRSVLYALGTGFTTAFNVSTGPGKPQTIWDFIVWESVLPLHVNAGAIVSWFMPEGMNEMCWDMSTFYKGDQRRFGVSALRTGGGNDVLQVSFQISEG